MARRKRGGGKKILKGAAATLYKKFEEVRKQHNRVYARGFSAEKVNKRDFLRAYETYKANNNGSGKGFVEALLNAQLSARFQKELSPYVDLRNIKGFKHDYYTFSNKAVRGILDAYNRQRPMREWIGMRDLGKNPELFESIFSEIAEVGYWYDIQS